MPAPTSMRSLTPSPSLSALVGLVPAATSAASLSPSPSLSGSRKSGVLIAIGIDGWCHWIGVACLHCVAEPVTVRVEVDKVL